MKIYTKKGDKGETGLIGGKRVPKTDPVVEALGTIDELNAHLGNLNLPLEKIQQDLMALASEVAGGKKARVNEKWLEKEIDRMEKELPPLHNFILPTGSVHLARAVCRRTERRVTAVLGYSKYLNRLSDYLFVLARWVTREKSYRAPS
ncbi:cob(I)yrinic acid a,c-diamide adenosyltransferase [Patescibacteria group bacterium]|nr:cob(I)yrinic acid a,c-diamide adenosyltransferase [Patescibacteria group bacterium]